MSSPSSDSDRTTPDAEDIPLLAEPADGVPEVVTDADQLARVVAAIAAGTGPVALDAERASGYRYSSRAYLVQLRRAGAGSVLIDPIAVPDLASLNEAIGEAEWILHAADQDLPCLAEVGLHPARLFDTELAGRLLGEERVNLGAMVQSRLGLRLLKEHSAADWSTRPLPHDWLVYAALDVEVLIELRDAMAAQLDAAGKSEWAHQEFEHVRTAAPAPPRPDPWRRTSGLHRVRNPRQLAVVRALWTARDERARDRDIAPGRLLPDRTIVEIATAQPRSERALAALSGFSGPRMRRQVGRWYPIVAQALALPNSELPPLTGRGGDGVPPTNRWRDREPEAAVRLAHCRATVAAIADEHQILGQNLLASDVVRHLAWNPPTDLDVDTVAAALRENGAREWQVELAAAPLAAALEDARAESTAAAD